MNNIAFNTANQGNSYMPGFQQAAPSAAPWMNQTAGIQDSHMDISGITVSLILPGAYYHAKSITVYSTLTD